MIAGATVWPLVARAQQPALPVVGWISETPRIKGPLETAVRKGMAESGYVEGKNFASEYRLGPESFPQAAADLVRLKVNAIFAETPTALAAVSKTTTSIPIVGVDLESDPVAKGYAKSLARPGGNVTGMFLDIPELSGKQVELLKAIVPRLSRIAIFGDPSLNALQFAATESAARALAVEAEIMEVRVRDDFEGALEMARRRHVDAGVLLSSPLAYLNSKKISELALAKRLPLISLFGQFPKTGGLLAYGPNVGEMFRRCGSYVGKILAGAKPGDLPIQRPEKFDLVINLMTAAALGLSVPPVLLTTADEVIE
ncbi:MAG TPA: ABC transporter substrate-binding protein [Bryobacteraceae bacterium]|nr:ABC transporter substrate-binding protein [Bryobacteraceae bacterium]